MRESIGEWLSEAARCSIGIALLQHIGMWGGIKLQKIIFVFQEGILVLIAWYLIGKSTISKPGS